MSDRRSARRRGLAVVAIAACALSLAFAVPGLVTGAGANVASPGNVDVSLSVSVLTPNLTLSGITTTVPASATIAANGILIIPRSSLTFAPIQATIAAPNPALGNVTVQLLASSDFVGGVNPAGHAELLAGSFQMLVSQTGTMTGCPIGPFAAHVTTTGAGTRPYDSTTGAATMVDSNFALPAIPTGTSGCGGLEGSLNGTLSLPITTTTTTTAVTTSSTSTTTTTTEPPTATTSPTSLLADTPVPAVVVTATITPSPIEATPTTRPTPTTVKRHPTTTHAPTTVAPKKVATKHHKKKPLTTTSPAVKHHKKHHKKHVKKSHKKHHKKTTTTLGASAKRAATTSTTRSAALHRRGHYFGVATTVAPKRHKPRPAGIPIDTTLVSSRHRASPSALNFLAILALLVSGWFAVKLVRPDFEDLRRSRRKRGRLYGIEPRMSDEA